MSTSTQPSGAPSAAPAAAPVLRPFKSMAYAGTRSGTRLVVTGAVHGDETCGTRAIERLAAELDAGTLRVTAGRLTLVPVANPLAYAHERRTGDRNLNRKLTPTSAPAQFEDHVANWLCPILEANEVLLDLHSFSSPGVPFVFLGPEDNTGAIEPFAQATREEALAARLGVNRAVDGWLTTYAVGVARRRELAARRPDLALDLDPRYGIGTTEYMRSVGGCALTLECGQNADPEAPAVAYRAIRRTLAHLGLVDEPDPAPAADLEALHLVEVVERLDPGDRFAREWKSFDAIEAGTLIGTRHDGTPVVAAHGGRIVFPNPDAPPLEEWFYLARTSTRFSTANKIQAP
jgi:predicted deacylase